MKYVDFSQKIPQALFTRQDIKLLGIKIFGSQLSLWQKHGYIKKIRNGLYIFTQRLKEISIEEIAGQIYAPSYISLEKALAHYGLIPEMVYTLTMITPKTSRKAKNQFGHFIYRHIKPALFFGYKQMQGKNIPYLLAEPEKALLDFIYFNLSKIKTAADFTAYRFNRHILREKLDRKKLNHYASLYKNKKIAALVKLLVE